MTAMEAAMQQPGESAGLSQVERVVDTFVAPTKTFTDILRDASWWLPFLLSILVSLAFVTSIDRQIGFEQVAQTNINRNAQAQQRMSGLTDAQRQQQIHTIANVTRVISYVYPVLGVIFALICAGILMMSFNFGLGAKASYKEYLAVWFYAGLPYLIKFLLAAIAIFAGVSAEQFDINNPVGTNVGWYLTSDVPLWVRTLFSSADIFTLWAIVLLILGCSIVARVKRSSAAIVIIGWWVLIILAGTIMAAVQG
jgi:hypothetical protein